ncbi:response regulator receiver protein [Marinobacterium aestuarii]|uniref:Response regulator receiver protein n=1 Tax=Marinobacterium aestuarii TaxID=1821621 RepID=A0A1A9EVG7_9GAMM|nr:response regulator [Marinobacterium aestuarii]ANG62164.1 response regulator receiver protein [Marinobacterium aestuarii]
MKFKPDDICTSRKAAEMLGVSARTVQLWADAEVIESWKTPGGHRRFSLLQVEKLVRELQDGKGPVLSDAQNEADASRNAPVRVLVIDDEKVLLRLYELTLKSWQLPLELHLSDNGYSGLLSVGQVEPQLLVLDLNLPNIDGFSIIAALKHSGLLERMELMVISALEADEVLTRMPVGVECQVLPKPIPFNEIKLRVEQILERQRNR